ncbi:hypothetical protein P9J82_04755 [Glaesserella parasuis]|uniref:hypothetical protein n=1 Tax=Pasteurellaceae TaxID=712 RepID=UPI00094F5756|nr:MULTISPECIES: hypothetical protein [Pasteurellaceae]MCT8558207.1 hypothetical protein [Glaesserella parasuis]MCT8782031.1 hypothetical protein [Glaesserella parasuis]MCT8822328.1 hypothetical protein [Glaesserella parasuis]MDD6910122.1 hypothetical protein [Actinobacillus minor]MDG4923298.1 hypothetical protein [Glaesserella parasuis]
MFKSLKKTYLKLGLAVSSLGMSGLALASEQTVDYSALTSKIDFSSAMTAVLGVIALIVGALVTWKGGQWIIKAVRNA